MYVGVELRLTVPSITHTMIMIVPKRWQATILYSHAHTHVHVHEQLTRQQTKQHNTTQHNGTRDNNLFSKKKLPQVHVHVHVHYVCICYSYTIGASGVSEWLVYGRARGRSPSGLRKLSHECSIRYTTSISLSCNRLV